MYSASDVAKWFINEIHPEPLKLQKLLYFSQGYSYAFLDRPLFNEEIEGWVHGPVVPSVYHQYKEYTYSPIMLECSTVEFDEESLNILCYVRDNYANYEGKELEDLTHKQEPWIISRQGLDPDERSDKTITKESIYNYFTSMIHQPSEEEWN